MSGYTFEVDTGTEHYEGGAPNASKTLELIESYKIDALADVRVRDRAGQQITLNTLKHDAKYERRYDWRK